MQTWRGISLLGERVERGSWAAEKYGRETDSEGGWTCEAEREEKWTRERYVCMESERVQQTVRWWKKLMFHASSIFFINSPLVYFSLYCDWSDNACIPSLDFPTFLWLSMSRRNTWYSKNVSNRDPHVSLHKSTMQTWQCCCLCRNLLSLFLSRFLSP